MDLATKEIELVIKVNLLGALLCTQVIMHRDAIGISLRQAAQTMHNTRHIRSCDQGRSAQVSMYILLKFAKIDIFM